MKGGKKCVCVVGRGGGGGDGHLSVTDISWSNCPLQGDCGLVEKLMFTNIIENLLESPYTASFKKCVLRIPKPKTFG